MKKIFVSLLLGGTLFISCKKEATEPVYYVRLQVNGEWITWNHISGEIETDLIDPSKINFTMRSNNNEETDVFKIEIQVTDTEFRVGSYDTDHPNHDATVAYSRNVSSANVQEFDLGSSPGRPDSRFIITVGSVTEKEVRGTFTGNYLVDASGISMDVTQGQFWLKREQ